jgi:ubiquinone/menaquinone biosynthesis C-methylase UbiE
MRTEQRAEITARDASALGYAADYRRGKGAWWDDHERKLLIQAIGPRPGLRVLDAGSGVGRVAIELARRQCAVIAVDFSVESLRVLNQTAQSMPDAPRTIMGDVSGKLPLPASVVDAIVSSQVVHHIPTRGGRLAAWRELARVATSRAPLAVVVYNAKHGSQQDGYFNNGISFHRYRIDELAAELAASGWQPIQTLGFHRLDWPAIPASVPTLVESLCARMHFADDRATYLFGRAVKKQ